MAPTTPLVDIADVDIVYGEAGVEALKGASLSVAKGGFSAVVGPSGCGKSSLMRLVTGLMPATRGTVMVSGAPVDGPLKIAGMAFQNPTLLPWRNTLQNVMLPLEIVQPHRAQLRSRRKEYEDKAMALLASVGLEDFADKAP